MQLFTFNEVNSILSDERAFIRKNTSQNIVEMVSNFQSINTDLGTLMIETLQDCNAYCKRFAVVLFKG